MYAIRVNKNTANQVQFKAQSACSDSDLIGFFVGAKMKTLDIMAIPLTQGLFTLIDGKNYEWLNKWKWCVRKDHNVLYVTRAIYNSVTKTTEFISMHRQILGLHKGDGKTTDHKNHCGLDNREANIRICTNQQNRHNGRRHFDNTSGYKGVSWDKQNKKWRVHITKNRKIFYLGCYNDKQEAARIYDAKARELHGEFAKTNF